MPKRFGQFLAGLILALQTSSLVTRMNLAGVLLLVAYTNLGETFQIYPGFPPFYGATPNSPQRVPQLGLFPQNENLAYNYINSYAGPLPQQKISFPVRVEDFGPQQDEILFDRGQKEPLTERPNVFRPSHLLPSDFILLAQSPQSQFFGNFDSIKNSQVKVAAAKENTALPPIGGSVSNFILNHQNDWTTQEKSKRQTFDDNEDDSVEITAGKQKVGEMSNNCSTTNNDTQTQQQPPEQQASIAQSKPAAVALAGIGGVAQASPVGTAVVGPGGLAVAAPSATAVAGQGAQAAVQLSSDEKVRKGNSEQKKEKEADD